MEKQGSSEDWETESETSSSADVTEMEVSVEWRSVGLRDAERPRASVLRYLALWERNEMMRW